jgi:hypothetical protein
MGMDGKRTNTYYKHSGAFDFLSPTRSAPGSDAGK